MSNIRTVHVTGLAVSTCCGVGSRALFDRLRSGVRVTTNDHGEVRFPDIDVDISAYVRTTRTENEPTRQLLAALAADLEPEFAAIRAADRCSMGVVLGNTSGNVDPYCGFYTKGVRDGHYRVNPTHLPVTLINYQASAVSHALGLMGQCTTLSSGFSAGLDAIACAAMRLQSGRERAILAGGVQELSRFDRAYLHDRQLLSATGRVRPFHAARDGTVGAEAVGLLLLTGGDTDDASLARISGWAWAAARGSDPMHRAAVVLRAALAMANVEPGEIDLVFPSANGTVEGDDLESQLLQHVFDDRLGSIGLCPVKSVVGECLTAAGPVQCAAAVHALNGGAVCARPLEAWIGSDSTPSPESTTPATALVYSLGLDGSCSAIVLHRN